MPCAVHFFLDEWSALSFIIDITNINVIYIQDPLRGGFFLGYWGKLEGEAFFAVFLSV